MDLRLDRSAALHAQCATQCEDRDPGDEGMDKRA
jgi:hypothetical protein